MKKLFVLLLLLTATAAYASHIASDCTFNGKKLYGKVQIVEHLPDFKVQIVDHFPDFKVQIVESGADFKIKKVDFFPGL